MASPLLNRQKEWRVPSHLHLAIHDGDMHVWCHFPRTKQLPIGKYLQTTPFREIICKKTPDGSICRYLNNYWLEAHVPRASIFILLF